VKGVHHRLDTGDGAPIKRGSRPLSPFERDEIDRQMAPMEKWNVIRTSTSPFAAPVILARKKGGKWRFCVDYRALNKMTVPSRYPLPRIDGILDKHRPARFFTTLDAQSGYWQIPMHPDDVHKTAFLTHRGLFEFLRMPFGLTTAPGTYQMVMDDLLQEELRGTTPTVTQYLDDTLLFTVTFEEHLVVLEAVLTKVESIDLKLCPSKCLFGANETEHLIAHNLLLPAPEKVRAIRDWIDPINVAEVRSFLGLAGYYRHFIRDFAKIAKPLHSLTREQATFKWGEHEKLSMELLKDALCQTQGLTRPYFNKPFLLDTDYSRIGIGATLSQVNDLHEERPIAFASRALHGAEANYSTTDGELLAYVWAITVRFRSYLYGGPTFVARVDHNPLVWLHQRVNLQGRLARWHIRFMEFNFTVEHRVGRAHFNVDPLSRNPVAALPWEIEAGELDDFPESAAPEFEAQNPPAHPTVRMALLVAEDVDSSEGIGNGAITDAEPRTPEEETSRHSETPRDAPSKAREGSPTCGKGACYTPSASSRGADNRGRSTLDPWAANGAPSATSARSPPGEMERSRTPYPRNPRSMDTPHYSRLS
jgi:hypothetical protein